LDYHGKQGLNVLVIPSPPRLFKFKNSERGLIEFKGNLLFTHFSEINAPSGGGDLQGDLEITNAGADRHNFTINEKDSSNM